MNKLALPLVLVAGSLAAISCQSALHVSNADALDAVKLEVQVDGVGAIREIEYHIPPALVPPAVQAAMDALHPGGAYTDAEREYHGGQVYYELNRMVGGLEVEAMFLPDGTLHSEEVEIPASKVPEAVRLAITRRYPQSRVTKYEEIRDGKRALVEYHVKLVRDGMAYKVMLGRAGEHLGAFREIVSEIEVPVD